MSEPLELVILDLVSRGRRGLPDLEAASGKNKSSVYRACVNLVESGWLIDLPADLGGGYALADKARLLWLREVERLRSEAAETAVSLFKMFGMTVIGPADARPHTIADDLAAVLEPGPDSGLNIEKTL